MVSCAGLVPVMRLAQQVGQHDAIIDRVRLPGGKGANPAGKVATIVAGMLAGADSIDDLDIARHGGMPSLFTGVYAPSTLGSFLRGITHVRVRQVGGYDVGLRGYNPLIASLSTPVSAPVIAATRLRSGNAGSARGAESMIDPHSCSPRPKHSTAATPSSNRSTRI